MLKTTVTILSIAVISLMGYAQATPDAKEGFVNVQSGKNKITALALLDQLPTKIELEYYTKDVDGPKMFATVTLTDMAARTNSKGLNMFLEWAPPKNWGEKSPGKDKDGHVQRLLLSVDLSDSAKPTVQPYFAKTQDLKVDGDVSTNTSNSRAANTKQFCEKGHKQSQWYENGNDTLKTEWKKAINVKSVTVDRSAKFATATIKFEMPFAFPLNPTQDLSKDTSLVLGMCGGFTNNPGDDTSKLIMEKSGDVPQGFHFPIPAAPGKKLLGTGAAFITMGSTVLLTAIASTF